VFPASAAQAGGGRASGGQATRTTTPNDVAITLARPTGPFRTGTTLIHLRDQRIDPLDPRQRAREVMAQLWYPALPAPDRPLVPYASPGETAVLETTYGADPVPDGAFAAMTHSRLRAPVHPGIHKVVFFHHGICGFRMDTTAINERLASLGFIVVALGSTHESPAVEFPGGRVETTTDESFCATGADPFSPSNQAILQRMLDVRVADTRFVLDQLGRVNRGVNPDASGVPLPRGLARSMDTSRVGIFGHSFGGGTAAAVMHTDSRFVAGVNLDGLLVGPVRQAGLDRPFLVLGSSFHDLDLDESWADFLPRLTGWHRWLRVNDAGHYRFIDFGGSVRKWGLEAAIKPSDPETWRTVFGDIDDRTSQEIVIRLTSAFFGRFLRGRPSPILICPSAFYPQIEDRTSGQTTALSDDRTGHGQHRSDRDRCDGTHATFMDVHSVEGGVSASEVAALGLTEAHAAARGAGRSSTRRGAGRPDCDRR
jgi:predicted dienelactone hydrolase